MDSSQKHTKKDTIDPKMKNTAMQSHTDEEISTFKLTIITTAPKTNMPSTYSVPLIPLAEVACSSVSKAKISRRVPYHIP